MSAMLDELVKQFNQVSSHAWDVESAAQDLDRSVSRLSDLIEKFEIDAGQYAEVVKQIEKLYMAKLTLSPELFEQFLKDFFISTIDKRL